MCTMLFDVFFPFRSFIRAIRNENAVQSIHKTIKSLMMMVMAGAVRKMIISFSTAPQPFTGWALVPWSGPLPETVINADHHQFVNWSLAFIRTWLVLTDFSITFLHLQRPLPWKRRWWTAIFGWRSKVCIQLCRSFTQVNCAKCC